ncbi:alpha-galactosidase isoform X2 [Selaginella moellendorffii]|uniref:alpha-galactosidase isoform X2 n=1 Tax=Selaginella moellendorffii TaxID=88036 RepID=UPI000D1C3C03|nr:alpha-galactosidase isoform X2 [Selaginella moellendorffii]|eukprot:XP_002962360.2 alpha-galactosidase isoform X2 [Selaginella moellendorffii]
MRSIVVLVAGLVLGWIDRALDLSRTFLVRWIGVKRLHWISKHLVPWSLLYWIGGTLRRNFVMWRNCGVILGVVLLTWKTQSRLLGSSGNGKMQTKWNVTAAVPLPRRLVYDNGLGKTPIMGWSGWNKYECKINEKIVFGNTDALVRHGLDQLGYNYVIVDDCWAAYKRDKQGNLKSHPTTFPSGMKALADYAHSKGLKFGLYSDAGRRTCIGHRAGSEDHEIRDAKTFASWGVDYLKYDNCFHKKHYYPHLRYPVMSEALNKSGRPIFYTICEWGEDHPALWAGKYANSWRTSLDVKDRWDRIQILADDNNMWAAYAGPGGWNDPDMLQVGNGRMSVAEYRSHFSIWSIMKAPLIIGCELRKIREEHLEIYKNKEIIDINQDPLGIQARKVSRQGRCKCREVWAGPLSGKRIVLALWNRDWRRVAIKVNWFDLGLEPGVSVRVRDLWKHEDWSERQQDGFEVAIDSHDCGVYILSDVRLTSDNVYVIADHVF